MGAHAFLPPSGAHSWVSCAMWAAMNRLYPQDDTDASREGTAAHWAFAEGFYNRPVTLASVADNGVQMTPEMLDGAKLYVETVDEDLRAVGLDRRHLHVEQPIAVPSVHAANWGTPDTWFGSTHAGIKMYDYKFGHRFVDAYQNWQCIDYLLGVADALGIDGRTDQQTPFEIVVVQPRNYDGDGRPRRWKGMLSDLRAHRNTLKMAAEASFDEAPAATPGDHCYECPGRHSCTALQRTGYKAVWLSQQSAPLELSDRALGHELYLLRRAAAVLKERIGGLEEDAFVRITRKGAAIPRHAVEQTLGREYWGKPAEEVIALGRLFGHDLGKLGTVTPKQAVKAGMPEQLVAGLTRQESKGLKLVEDDGRKAAKAFGK